nr:origin recognition complex subunit 2 [Quercus suber]
MVFDFGSSSTGRRRADICQPRLCRNAEPARSSLRDSRRRGKRGVMINHVADLPLPSSRTGNVPGLTSFHRFHHRRFSSAFSQRQCRPFLSRSPTRRRSFFIEPWPSLGVISVASPRRVRIPSRDVSLVEEHRRNMPKRRREVGDDESIAVTPRKSRRSVQETQSLDVDAVTTPTSRTSILRRHPANASGIAELGATPKSLRKVLFSTPVTSREDVENAKRGEEETTPTALRNDRSARRKSQRALRDQETADVLSDEEDDGLDAAIAREILGQDDDNDESADDDIQLSSAVDTPTKTARPRGRPKGKRRERTPTPPLDDLPPHELYFFQNRNGGTKTSANTLPSQLLLKHEDYHTQINKIKDAHEEDIDRLKRLHRRAFDQWMFELNEGFNICLYGYGSKRNLTDSFAQHVYAESETIPQIVVVNGYAPALSLRDIISTLAQAIVPKHISLPAQPQALLNLLTTFLSDHTPSQPMILIMNSLDHIQLRKPSTQSFIAQIAAHPAISLVATCDTPNFPLLWDVTLTRRLRFLYHDSTTFEPYKAEIDTVEDVNMLLGRTGRRIGGKDGVGFVLKSLPENARSLFRILVAEQLALAHAEVEVMGTSQDFNNLDAGDILGAEDEEEALAAAQSTPSRRSKKGSKPKPVTESTVVATPTEGIEYRSLYHKAVEEFVCSSELNFRTLLKEYQDHQIIESRKDGMGMERLFVPLEREDLEILLEELSCRSFKPRTIHPARSLCEVDLAGSRTGESIKAVDLRSHRPKAYRIAIASYAVPPQRRLRRETSDCITSSSAGEIANSQLAIAIRRSCSALAFTVDLTAQSSGHGFRERRRAEFPILPDIRLRCDAHEHMGGSLCDVQLRASQWRTPGIDLDFRGWFCVLGWQAGAAGQAFGTGLQIQGLIILNDVTYVSHPWHSTLLAIAVVVTAAIFNTLLARKLPIIENVMLVLHIVGFFAILITLWVTAPKASNSEVWTEFTNMAGWPTTGLAFCVGLTGSITSLIAEEIRDASRVVPQAMLWTLFLNGIAGFVMTITFAYCLGPLDAALKPEFGFAFIGTFYNATSSHAGATFMTCIITLLTLCSAIGNVATGSRQLFAFARDQGLPFGRWLSYARWDLPLNAIVITSTIASLLSLINLGSSVAFNAILSIGVVSLLSSYIVSISCIIIKRIRGEALLARRWDLRAWGLPLNIIGLAYLILVFVFAFFPLGTPVVASEMNWASAAYGGVAIFATLYYVIWAKRRYISPVSKVAKDL